MTPSDVSFGGITSETFDSLNEKQQLRVIFDLLAKNCSECQHDIRKLKRGRKVDTTLAGLMGLIGGFIAELLSKFK